MLFLSSKPLFFQCNRANEVLSLIPSRRASCAPPSDSPNAQRNGDASKLINQVGQVGYIATAGTLSIELLAIPRNRVFFEAGLLGCHMHDGL
jgi:hypothetical protein